MEKFKFLPHTADIKFRAFGDSLENCFKNASYALKEIISKDKVKNKIKKQIKLKGRDFESLLYNFLEEFLFLFETKGFLLGKINKIQILKNFDGDKEKDLELNAEISGDKGKYKFENHVKAITYHEMFVKLDKNKYVCQVIVDV